MAEVIPISKTPTQEKVPFVAPKLDWNENGNYRRIFTLTFLSPKSNLNQLSFFSSFFLLQDGDHASFPTPSRTCPINRSARATVWARLAIGLDRRKPTRNTTTISISRSSGRAVNMLTTTTKTKLLSIWSTPHASKSRLISVDVSVVETETTGKKKKCDTKLKMLIDIDFFFSLLLVVVVLAVVFKLVT